MQLLDPTRLAQGNVDVPNVTAPERDAYTRIGQRIIGLQDDLTKLSDPAHIQVVQDLIDDLVAISAAIHPGYKAASEAAKAAMAEGKATRITANLEALRAQKKPLVTLGQTTARFNPNRRPDGVGDTEWQIVEIACFLLEQIATKAASSSPTLSVSWLRTVAEDVRDMAELCGVRLSGGMVPGRYRNRRIKEPSVWDQ